MSSLCLPPSGWRQWGLDGNPVLSSIVRRGEARLRGNRIPHRLRAKAQAPQAEAEEAQMTDPRIPYLLREARYLIRIGQWNDKTMRIVEK
jgi:hypothetical protein